MRIISCSFFAWIRSRMCRYVWRCKRLYIHGRVKWWCRYGRDEKRRAYNELHIGRVHEYFYHATQQCTHCSTLTWRTASTPWPNYANNLDSRWQIDITIKRWFVDFRTPMSVSVAHDIKTEACSAHVIHHFNAKISGQLFAMSKCFQIQCLPSAEVSTFW